MEEKIVNFNINDANEQWFLEYAQEVLQNRALPDAEDGLIVAQRELLWTMSKVIKMKPTDSYKKSSSLVGSTMAESYVHGDASLYDVLRNLSLPFVMRYPLIDPHGSMGTQESSDLYASARYTEARPSVFVPLMIKDSDKNAVPMKLTYTNESYEPVVLPSLIPNALVNGHYGIGVSMSSSTLPHNLGEVCDVIIEYLDKKGTLSVDDIINIMPGPDFPTGGTIINKSVIRSAFESGKSYFSIKIRGDYTIEGNKIIFSSIPYRAYRADIRKQLNKKIEDVEKYFDDFNDYSQIGNTKLIFNVKNGVSPEDALDFLFQYTDLQSSVSYNNNFVYHGTPKMCSMYDLIKIYVDHQRDIKMRVAAFDEEKAEKKVNILEGLLKILGDIDNTVKLIKESSNRAEARTKLIDFFKINEEQANAVLDLKLARLTKLDVGEINADLEENKRIIDDCVKILEDEEYRDLLIRNDVVELRKLSDPRRTKISEIAENLTSKAKKEKESTPMTIGFFDGGIVKTIQNTRLSPIKEIQCHSTDYITIFCDNNICYKLKAEKVKDMAQDLYSLCGIDRNVKILDYALSTEEGFVVSLTKCGMIKKSDLSLYSSPRQTTLSKLSDGDSIISVLVNPKGITLESTDSYHLSYMVDDITSIGKATKGIKSMKLHDGQFVKSAIAGIDQRYLGKHGQSGKKND
jgi:DNA gyrase/topoisomerase IV subunit A